MISSVALLSPVYKEYICFIIRCSSKVLSRESEKNYMFFFADSYIDSVGSTSDGTLYVVVAAMVKSMVAMAALAISKAHMKEAALTLVGAVGRVIHR